MVKEELIEELKLDNIEKYKKDFDPIIAIRGEYIYRDNKIKELKNKGNKYSATVSGTNDYKVEVEFDDNDNIKNMRCTCPNYKKGYNCKHIYSVVFATKIEQYLDPINKYIDRKLKEFKERYKDSRVNNASYIDDKIKELEDKLKKQKCLYQRFNIAIKLIMLDKRLDFEEERLDNKNVKSEITITITNKEDNNEISKFKDIFKYFSFNKETTYTDEELRNLDLDEDQIKEVREGNQEPWDFEEENLEEDDYFYEDDE